MGDVVGKAQSRYLGYQATRPSHRAWPTPSGGVSGRPSFATVLGGDSVC